MPFNILDVSDFLAVMRRKSAARVDSEATSILLQKVLSKEEVEHIDTMTPHLPVVQQLDENEDENENVNICSSDEDDMTKMDWSALQGHALQSSISFRHYTTG